MKSDGMLKTGPDCWPHGSSSMSRPDHGLHCNDIVQLLLLCGVGGRPMWGDL